MRHERDDVDVGCTRCPYGGVSAFPVEPANVIDSAFACENAECEAFGDAVES